MKLFCFMFFFCWLWTSCFVISSYFVYRLPFCFINARNGKAKRITLLFYFVLFWRVRVFVFREGLHRGRKEVRCLQSFAYKTLTRNNHKQWHWSNCSACVWNEKHLQSVTPTDRKREKCHMFKIWTKMNKHLLFFFFFIHMKFW